MRAILTVPVAAVLLAAAPGPTTPQGGEMPLTATAVRFFSPASGATTIEGLCEVRLSALPLGVGQVGRYRVEVAVLDSAGLELQRSDWTREVPAAVARARGATMVESFSFTAAPGSYRLRIRVVPATGEPLERSLDVRAFGARPAMSDLLLATEVRAADSTASGPGEVRRGGYVLHSAPAPRLTPTEAMLNWYAEVYPRTGDAAGEIRAEVVSAGGRVLVTTPARTVTIGARGAATPGSVDLTGLPEGAYRLRVRLRLPDTVLVSDAPFVMAPLTAVAQTAAPARSADADMFADASEARLDSLFAPLVYLQRDGNETAPYARLTVEGKRRFLRQFWQARDPTPETADNPRRDEFYRAVAYVGEAYGEHGRGEVPGWNTDRGRIYLKNGRPDEVLRRPTASQPYEAWKYTRGQLRYYVFIDRTGLGNFDLAGTNDRTEIQRPWNSGLDREAVQDLSRFLGLETGSQNSN